MSSRLQAFSSFTRSVRATAWVLRFVQVLRSRVRKQPVTFRELTADELAQAEHLLIAQSQAKSFPEERTALNDGKAMGRRSRLVQLHPILDDGGLIQAKGRVSKLKHSVKKHNSPSLSTIVTHSQLYSSSSSTQTVGIMARSVLSTS